MTELDKLNSQSANVLAKLLLKKAGVKPDPDLLYLYQLPRWALKSREVKIEDVTNRGASADLLNAIEMLLYQVDPKKAMKFLMEESLVELTQLAKQKEPRDAAAYLCDRIRSALIEGDYQEQIPE